ncbi:glycine oxidase [Pseudomonas nitritireducens]|uniref:Glycine oxidase n=1 Tax=Pseudomonas nitroreducens TaxID=46680 RepID=A0A7W7KMF0_PSENT|nr:glycine oxidase ThiO [Pseudomonas nitritireducens]MBB4865156.1 glycine oxidase [Pseudomonas nitritireducens]
MPDVIVVGGGVVGMLSAWTLGQAGAEVVLLERGETGREASWAGGGIVSPLYPWRYSAAVANLAHWSQDFYPLLGERLLADTGLDPQVHVTGLYWLDLDDQAAALAWAKSNGRPLSEVAINAVHEAVPVLGQGFERAVYMSGVANVRNPRLAKALREALVRLPNVSVHEQVEVTGFVQAGDQIRGVRTAQGDFSADAVVLAAGAWSGRILAQLGLELSVEPVKGQMILYRCAPDFLSSMVLAKGRYAIPRRDGHILIGSTLEHAGFDKTPSDEALSSLRASAEELIPALAGREPVNHWAGLRPGSPQGIPFIGEVPGHRGLWLNTGHYRNGLVLAPASCQLLADLMQKRAPIIEAAPYAPAGRLVATPIV